MNLNELIVILRKAETIEDIDKHRDEITNLIPKAVVMVDFDQKNKAHQYDLWEHCLHTVVNLPKDIKDDMVYLAALIHDIGKPDCQIKGEKDGEAIMHYYGHPERSYEITRDEIIPTLLKKKQYLSEDDIRRLLYYVRWHDDRMSLRMKHLRAHLKLGASL